MDFAAARHNMVDCQIRTNQVTDPLILDAMAELPREDFVPSAAQGIAYVDEAIAVGNGRYLMEPMVLARLLQTAAPEKDDVVLVIGCASGYSAAVLSRLASAVVALESDGELGARATRTLSELGIDTVAVVDGPLAEGFAGQGPYDVIFIDGAVDAVPAAVSDQLAEGGRLVAVVRGAAVGRATLMTRTAGIVSERVVFDATTPLLAEFAATPSFRF